MQRWQAGAKHNHLLRLSLLGVWMWAVIVTLYER